MLAVNLDITDQCCKNSSLSTDFWDLSVGSVRVYYMFNKIKTSQSAECDFVSISLNKTFLNSNKTFLFSVKGLFMNFVKLTLL